MDGIAGEVSDPMTTETATNEALESLFGRPDQGFFNGTVAHREKSARVKYWRKPESGATDSGWIMLGPDMQTDISKYRQFMEVKRYKELSDSFGKEVAGLPKSRIRPQKRYEAGQEHRWLETFMDNGGLTYIMKAGDNYGTPGEYLLPASQIVALGLHRATGMKQARPDLANVVDLECPYACMAKGGTGRRLFSGLTMKEAQQSVDQHVLAVHRETIASRAIGDEIAKSLGANAKMDAGMIAQIVAAVAAALQPNTPEPAPVAAVAQEVPGVDTTPVAPSPAPPTERFDVDTASRQEMMVFAKTMGIPTLPFSAKAEDWRAYLKERLGVAA